MAFNANVPNTTNTIAADLAAVNANWEYVISGDGTGGRVFRVSKLTIEYGDEAAHIYCTLESIWNGDNIAQEKGTKNEDFGNFNLSADGAEITIEAAALSGNAVACLGTMIYKNSVTDGYSVNVCATASSNDIIIYHKNAVTGAVADLSAEVESDEELSYYIFYITDA